MHSDIHKLSFMADAIEVYISIPLWITLTVVQGQLYMKSNPSVLSLSQDDQSMLMKYASFLVACELLR